VHCSFLQTLQKRESDLITDDCEPPCGCWDLNCRPSEEKSGALTHWAISPAHSWPLNLSHFCSIQENLPFADVLKAFFPLSLVLDSMYLVLCGGSWSKLTWALYKAVSVNQLAFFYMWTDTWTSTICWICCLFFTGRLWPYIFFCLPVWGVDVHQLCMMSF
jgi:hypothetical protein